METATDAFALVPLYTSGSISPLFGNNPSFLVWTYNATTYDIVDYTVHATNLSVSDQTTDWKKLFSASECVVLYICFATPYPPLLCFV